MSIQELRAQKKVIEAEIGLKQEQLRTVDAAICALEWVPIEWAELEGLLKEQYKGCGYRDCPIVSHRGINQTYCFITTDGQLQVGPYFHNDRFPRGTRLYVHSEMKTWGAA